MGIKIFDLPPDGLKDGGKAKLNTEQSIETPNEVLSRNVEKEKEKFFESIVNKFNKEGSPYFATSQLWDDGIIDPRNSREVLGLSLQIALNAPIKDTNFGLFRM